jgi:hypothetical protein
MKEFTLIHTQYHTILLIIIHITILPIIIHNTHTITTNRGKDIKGKFIGETAGKIGKTLVLLHEALRAHPQSLHGSQTDSIVL